MDRNPYKHGRFLPGTHIPIYKPERIRETKPDYLFILPWNLKDEIIQQNALYPRVGRAIRGADSDSQGVSVMLSLHRAQWLRGSKQEAKS